MTEESVVSSVSPLPDQTSPSSPLSSSTCAPAGKENEELA